MVLTKKKKKKKKNTMTRESNFFNTTDALVTSQSATFLSMNQQAWNGLKSDLI